MIGCTTYYDKKSQIYCPVLETSQEYIKTFVTNESSNIDILFVVDVSGSMSDRLKDSASSQYTKLELVKMAIVSSLDYFVTLGDRQHKIKFTLMTFNIHTSIVISEEINSRTSKTIREALNLLRSDGGTDIRRALNTVNLHLKNDTNKDANKMVFFITDGFHNKTDEISHMVDEFANSEFRSLYYSIGLGVAGEYDAELMQLLFPNFTGCPTSGEATDNIIGISCSGTCTVLKDVTVKFSEDIVAHYDIKTSCEKQDSTTYSLKKFTITTKIPIAIKAKTSDLTEQHLRVNIRGINKDETEQCFTFVLNSPENPPYEITDGNVFFDFYTYENEYQKILDTCPTSALIKFNLDELQPKVSAVLLEEFHPMFGLYVNLRSKIVGFLANNAYISKMQDQQFTDYMRSSSSNSRQQIQNYTNPASARVASNLVSTEYTITGLCANQYTKLTTESTPMRTNEQSPHVVFTNPHIPPVPLDDDPVERVVPEELPKDSQKCVSCFVNNIEILYFPCNHACVCIECAKKLTNCPKCNVKISVIIKLGTKCNCKCWSKLEVIYHPCMHSTSCSKCVEKKHVHKCEVCSQDYTKISKF